MQLQELAGSTALIYPFNLLTNKPLKSLRPIKGTLLHEPGNSYLNFIPNHNELQRPLLRISEANIRTGNVTILPKSKN